MADEPKDGDRPPLRVLPPEKPGATDEDDSDLETPGPRSGSVGVDPNAVGRAARQGPGRPSPSGAGGTRGATKYPSGTKGTQGPDTGTPGDPPPGQQGPPEGARVGPPPPGPGTSDSEPRSKLPTDARRKRVYDFYLRGVPQTMMAEMLGVHVNTISSDLKFLKEDARGRVIGSDPFMLVGEHEDFLTEVRATAMLEYQQHSDIVENYETAKGEKKTRRLLRGEKRARFLELAMRADSDLLDLRLKTGVIPKAPDKVDLGLTKVEGRDIRKMPSEEARQARDRLLERIEARRAKAAEAEKLVQVVSGATLDPRASTEHKGVPEFRPGKDLPPGPGDGEK